jgi:hypothetical protein
MALEQLHLLLVSVCSASPLAPFPRTGWLTDVSLFRIPPDTFSPETARVFCGFQPGW